MTKLSKELLGLAGEYAVASELCRRDIYSQLTLGHHKRTDILVETESKMLRIQVKAKQGYEWPAVLGLYREDDFLVFVDFKGKDKNERPDFYILDLGDWRELVNEVRKKHKGSVVDKQNIITFADGWRGIGIRTSSIAEYKERWEKITSRVEANRTVAPTQA